VLDPEEDKMRTITKVATAGVGMLAAGVLIAGPVLAAEPGDGYGPGSTSQNGRYGPGRGGCLLDAPSGTLTATQRSTLQANAQEEKLAHDLYTEFAARYDDPVFDRIAASETRHLEAFRTLLARYGITDPTAGQAAGSFSDATVKATYDRLLAEGLTGERAALGVGRTVETTDIADLRTAAHGLTAPDVQRVYQQLLNASQQHLTAFEYRL
jgi:hypothetical protein